MNRPWYVVGVWALVGCAAPVESPDDPDGGTTGTASVESSEGEDESSAAIGTSLGGSVSDATAAPDPSTTSGATTMDASAGATSDSSTGPGAPVVPGGVFLFVDGSEGGPDLYPTDLYERFEEASVEVELGETLPADFATRFGTMMYLNPLGMFDPAVNAAALELVERGGRVVLVMEHCKNGCYGSAAGHNEVLALLGSTMTFYGDGGGALESVSLEIDPAPPLTEGVDELVIYYSGSVDVGAADRVGTVPDGDTVIAREHLGWGEVVCIADGSMFGYVTDAGDNPQFALNLAVH